MFLVLQTAATWWTSSRLLNPRISNWFRKWLGHRWPLCNTTCAESVEKDTSGWRIFAGIKDLNAENYPSIVAKYAGENFIGDTNWQITTIPNTPFLKFSINPTVFLITYSDQIFVKRYTYSFAENTLCMFNLGTGFRSNGHGRIVI